MKTKSIKQIKKNAMISFIESFGWDNPIAVTLTVKKRIRQSDTWVSGDECLYGQNVRHFFKKLNRKVFGNKVRRGVALKTFCVSEVCASGRPHFHLQIDRPEAIDFEKFRKLISEVWASTDWAYDRVDVKPVYDRGWSAYMSKLRSKPGDFQDAICLQGCHRGSEAVK